MPAAKLVFPKRGDSEGVFRAFFDKVIDYKSPFRRAFMEEVAESVAFFESHQWLVKLRQSDPRYSPRVYDRPVTSEIPMPVVNEILGVVENEIAKLNRRHSKPYVRNRGTREGETAGARVGNEVINWALENQHWGRKRRLFISDFVLKGTGILKSVWRRSQLKVRKLGLTGAYRCQSQDGACHWFATPSVPASTALRALDVAVAPDSGQPLGPMDADSSGPTAILSHMRERMAMNFTGEGPLRDATYQLQDYCPVCAAQGRRVPLEQSIPTGDTKYGRDYFGRALSEAQPIGEPEVEVVDPRDFFPENDGHRITPDTMTWWVQETPRSLDWIAEFLPHKDLDKIQPESAEQILENHPQSGTYISPDDRAGGSQDNVYYNHVRLREWCCKPTVAFPKGRYVAMAGRVVLVDSDLMIPMESGGAGKRDPRAEETTSGSAPDTDLIPVVTASVARFWPRPGELFGQPITRPIISTQRRINMCYSQLVDTRQRHGVDGLMSTAGMRLRSPGYLNAFPGYNLVFDPDPEFPDGPKPIGARLMPEGVYTEIKDGREYIGSVTASMDPDTGRRAPTNVRAATGIKMLQDQIAIRRDPREEELKDAYRGTYSHQLLLLQRFAAEPRKFWAISVGKQWEEIEFRGSDLAGMTDVVVEEEAGYDQTAFQRESIMDADQMGLLPKQSPYARRTILKIMGVPPSIAEEENVQIEDAERKWQEFKDTGAVPVIEPYQDNHAIKFEFYGRQLYSEPGVRLKVAAQWDKILPMVAGWEEKLTQATVIDAQLRAMQKMIEQGQLPDGTPLPPGSVQMPPGWEPMPPTLEDKIVFVWLEMMKAKEYAPTEIALPFVRFEAVTEAHRLYAQGKAAQIQSGQPIQPAPGGMSLTPGQPGQQGGQQPSAQGGQGGPAVVAGGDAGSIHQQAAALQSEVAATGPPA